MTASDMLTLAARPGYPRTLQGSVSVPSHYVPSETSVNANLEKIDRTGTRLGAQCALTDFPSAKCQANAVGETLA